MSKKIQKFYERLGKQTQFERSDEKLYAYLKTNLKKKRVAYPRFMEYFKNTWENYIKTSSSMNIAQFFIDKGNEILTKWYSEVWPFPKSRLSFEFGRGGSQVDILITIKYEFSDNETSTIEEVIDKYKIEEKTETSAALVSLLEPLVLFGLILSEIIGQEFRVSIEDRTIESNQIKIETSARPK
ncbi:MAG TPA: hypothetical protein VMV49_10390 [Candidatus Deferrimicrobium sp.]|nr:hypothetical protein [Candidatus Deferrimicrobium sp.]